MALLPIHNFHHLLEQNGIVSIDFAFPFSFNPGDVSLVHCVLHGDRAALVLAILY